MDPPPRKYATDYGQLFTFSTNVALLVGRAARKYLKLLEFAPTLVLGRIRGIREERRGAIKNCSSRRVVCAAAVFFTNAVGTLDESEFRAEPQRVWPVRIRR